MTPSEIIIHHSAGEDRPGLDAGGIRRYHVQERGYLDIGYHALVEKVDGEYFALFGRRWHLTGAHCLGHNGRALGLCFVGNFNLAPPPDEMLAKGFDVIRVWLKAYGIPASAIFRHSDFASATDCPGRLFPWAKFIKLCGGQA